MATVKTQIFPKNGGALELGQVSLMNNIAFKKGEDTDTNPELSQSAGVPHMRSARTDASTRLRTFNFSKMLVT